MTLGGQPQWLANTLAGGSNRAHSDITSGQQDSNAIAVFYRQRSDEYGEAETVETVSARDYKSASDLIWQFHGQDRGQGETSPTDSRTWGAGGNNMPMVGVRRLTPTECERLQGFPDGWTTGQSDSVRYRQLGNAVAVPVVEWIARRLTQIERDTMEQE